MNRKSFLQATAGVLSFSGLSKALQTATSPYRRPKLKITDIRWTYVRTHGTPCHVRIYTDQGIYGHGECTDSAQGAGAIIDSFKRILIGQDPLNVDALWERTRVMGIFAGAQSGQYVTALTGIEIALWDLAGKAVGLPIYQLLGGKMRDRIRIYSDSATNSRNDPKAKETIQKMLDLGFTAVKIDIDDGRDPARFDRVNWTANNQEIEHMLDKVSFMRESLPKTVDLAVDMHGRYDMGTAKRVAREVEPFKLLFLEEPVPAENVDAMRDVRESCHTPICAGENVFLRHGFRPMLEKRAVDIVMPDIQKVGGLLEARKIADMAHTYYVPMAPHCVVSPIGTMASCHVCAAIPNFLVLEWHWLGNLDLWRNFVKEGDIFDKGWIPVSDKPGIGLEMNEEAVRKVQVKGTSWFGA
jgi:galactonate dehydratase